MPATRVLIVDDSAFVRKVLRDILGGVEDIQVVGHARNGIEALEQVEELRPDVMTLDVRMPELDGLGVLEALRGEGPRAIIVSSAVEDGDLVIKALQLGAVDVLKKPTSLATDRLYELRTELLEKVRVAAKATTRPVHSPKPTSLSRDVQRRRTKVVVIGTSTGGPRAITLVLGALPASFPAPIALVVHLPEDFSEPFAQRLDGSCALRVVHATNGLTVGPGMVVIGRAGKQLSIERSGEDTFVCRVEPRPLDALHCPSVNDLFRSASVAFGAGVLGVVLTGMGEDGLAGAIDIKAAGGRLLAEAESSCVVYGMPRAIAEANLGAEVRPLESIVEQILEML